MGLGTPLKGLLIGRNVPGARPGAGIGRPVGALKTGTLADFGY